MTMTKGLRAGFSRLQCWVAQIISVIADCPLSIITVYYYEGISVWKIMNKCFEVESSDKLSHDPHCKG